MIEDKYNAYESLNKKLASFETIAQEAISGGKEAKDATKAKNRVMIIIIAIIVVLVVSVISYKVAAKKAEEQYNKAFQTAQQAKKYSSRVAADSNCCVVVQPDGKVKAVIGKNAGSHGETNVNSWTDIDAVSNGGFCTVGLKTDGTVISTKIINEDKDYPVNYGQTKVGKWKDIVAIATGSSHTVGLRADGTVVSTKVDESVENSYDETKGQDDVNDWKDIVAIDAGYHTTVGLKADGTVVTAGETADTSTWQDVVDISTDGYFVMGLTSNGQVLCERTTSDTWDGSYYNDQATEWDDIAAIYSDEFEALGLKTDGTVVTTDVSSYYWDWPGEEGTRYRDWGQTDVQDWSNIVGLSSGDFYTVGIKSNGKLVITKIHDDEEDPEYTYDDGRNNVKGWKVKMD